MGQNLDVLLLREGHSDLGFVGFAQLRRPFLSGLVDDITFLITSNNHTANEVTTVLFMVTE